MKVLILLPLDVVEALPPRPTTRAVTTALLPPITKREYFYTG